MGAKSHIFTADECSVWDFLEEGVIGDLGEVVREWEDDGHGDAERFKELEFFGEGEQRCWNSSWVENFSRVIGKCHNNRGAVFFEFGKEVLMSEVDAVKCADRESGVGESGDVIEGGMDNHV